MPEGCTQHTIYSNLSSFRDVYESFIRNLFGISEFNHSYFISQITGFQIYLITDIISVHIIFYADSFFQVFFDIKDHIASK